MSWKLIYMVICLWVRELMSEGVHEQRDVGETTLRMQRGGTTKEKNAGFTPRALSPQHRVCEVCIMVHYGMYLLSYVRYDRKSMKIRHIQKFYGYIVLSDRMQSKNVSFQQSAHNTWVERQKSVGSNTNI